MKNKVLLLIPAYNEEKNIRKLLKEITERNLSSWADVIVVNDGSRDNTAVAVREANYELIELPYNMGYGAALQVGYKYARNNEYDYIIQLDADGQHDLLNIDLIYQKLTKAEGMDDKPDIVIGSRFLDSSGTFHMPYLKRLAIRIFRSLIKRVTKVMITDPTSGLQGLNRKAFSYYAEYSNFDYKYPDINMIIQMLLSGYRIQEVPAVMHERLEGSSMHSGFIKPIVYMLLMMLSTMNAIFRNSKNLNWK